MNERIVEILDKSDLNWTVSMESIKTESGIVLDGYSAIIRDDIKVPLSIRTDSYHPYQNHQLLELLDKVSNKVGLPIHKGGHFNKGGKVYIQLKSNDLRINNDKVEGFVTGINSFDGSTSLSFGNSTITISCQNTFFAAFNEMETRVRHTKNMIIKIDEICRRLERSLDDEKEMFSNITKLSETRIDNNVRDLVTKMLFNVDRQADLQDMEALSTVTRNKLSRFFIDLNGEIQQKGDNMWGLFSGVTKYTTHSLSKGDNTESKLFGSYGIREREIFNHLVEMV